MKSDKSWWLFRLFNSNLNFFNNLGKKYEVGHSNPQENKYSNRIRCTSFSNIFIWGEKKSRSLSIRFVLHLGILEINVLRCKIGVPWYCFFKQHCTDVQVMLWPGETIGEGWGKIKGPLQISFSVFQFFRKYLCLYVFVSRILCLFLTFS